MLREIFDVVEMLVVILLIIGNISSNITLWFYYK